MTTLLLAEHDNVQLSDHTRRALTAALALEAEVHVLVAGEGSGGVARAAGALAGVGKVLHLDASEFAHPLAEPYAELIVGMAGKYDAVLAAASAFGRNVMPRVAALLDVMQISDVVAVERPTRFRRPIYAGNAIQTVETDEPVRILTIRTAAFSPAASGGAALIESIAWQAKPHASTFFGLEQQTSDRPDLASARIVVSGGRGLGSKENFEALLFPLAKQLGAAVGASRAAVDAGYAPNDLQVGQTGKVVAPAVYFAIGISGAIQHLAGMKDSKVIVAINKDEDAP
ncbi:MAG: electron transfer flavoprotein subunit alpha/FixB family protein, partial [Devosia sp.]|nr:electron transfer flavoprotein subunit alpha/FixB family protein [Devosia sp.]